MHSHQRCLQSRAHRMTQASLLPKSAASVKPCLSDSCLEPGPAAPITGGENARRREKANGPRDGISACQGTW